MASILPTLGLHIAHIEKMPLAMPLYTYILLSVARDGEQIHIYLLYVPSILYGLLSKIQYISTLSLLAIMQKESGP